MPIFEYLCRKCGYITPRIQKVAEKSSFCVECDGEALFIPSLTAKRRDMTVNDNNSMANSEEVREAARRKA